VSFVRWFNEWSSHLDEVLKVSVLISGTTWSSSLCFVLSDHISKDLSPSFVGDSLTSSEVCLFFGDGLIEVSLQLILKRSLSRFSELGVFVKFLKLLVISFIGEQLEWMDIVGHEFKFSVSLISESSCTTMLDLLGWSLRGKWNSEELSEGDDKSFLKN